MNDVHQISLPGLDAANPLGFLAALGTWRTAEAIYSGNLMSWQPIRGHWSPILTVPNDLTEDEFVQALHTELSKKNNHSAFTFSKNLKLKPSEFETVATQATKAHFNNQDTEFVAFIAAFGSSVATNEQGDIEDTALRTMSGAGHQHFLKTMNDLVSLTTTEQIHHALFHNWTYPDEKVGLRWDPGEDKRYALAWKNPSSDATMTQRGANRLAIEALPLLPTAPVGKHLETTGFTGHRSNDTFFTWPIWEPPISFDTTRSLLALQELQSEKPDARHLRARGIAAVFRSQRITTGKFRNFTPARAV